MGHFTFSSTIAKAVVLISLLIPLIHVAADELPNLRILTLGDSITKGNGESSNNGYRKRLRDKLIAYADGDVDMIGSLRAGSMFDNDHEGHSGEMLRQIREHISRSIPAQPNIVLVHAGTNNMDLNVDVEEAPGLMESIIDMVFDGSPDAAVLVAPIIWADKPDMQARTDVFNERLEGIITRRQGEGQHILSVPIDITKADLADAKHPNNSGYQKMADAWFKAIQDANGRKWIKTPVKVNPVELPGMGLGYGENNDGGESANCGSGNWSPEGPIFSEIRVWKEVGEILHPVENGRRDKVILADLNGDVIDDYILADDDGTVRAWINEGEPNRWVSLGKVNPNWSTITGEMIRLADVDNDGCADLIALYSNGAAKVWKNVDNGRKFEALDSRWATGLEAREKIHFHDMDGDGYADYVIVYEGGAVKWARNTRNNGADDNKRNWEEAVEIAPGPAGVPNKRARLYDLDRDSRSDYVVVYEGGAVRAWRNTGYLNGKGSGSRNWDDLGTIAPGVRGVTGEMIRFADMDGDGLADFIAIAEDGSMRMWKNLGLIGSNKGSSIRFARLNKDKKVDIVSVDGQGRARAWLNEGLGKWNDIGEIAPGLDEDLSQAEIQFADVNGDGFDDFLVVFVDGSVRAYLNNGNLPDKTGRIWQQGQQISPGVGEPGRKVRFPDLNGDGYADYCIVFDGGAVDCFLNRQNIPPKDGGRIWEHRKTIATGVGWPGDRVRFADITGDGKDDYLIQYKGGGATAYNNTGNIPDAGRVRNWYGLGTISTGVDPQGPVRYADIDGDGKDDYLVVWGGGTIVAYINSCDWKLPDPGPGDGDGGLNYNSTCDDLQRNDDGTYNYTLWNDVGTNEYWTYFLSFDPGSNQHLLGALARAWGVTVPTCNVNSDCNIPTDCGNYDPQTGSARAELIMRSIYNFHDYYSRLRQAIEDCFDAFGTLQTLFQEYYPAEDLENEGLATLLGTLDTVFGLAAAVSGSNALSIGSEIFSAIGDTLTDELANEDEEIEHATDLAEFAYIWLQGARNKTDNLHNDLLNYGYYESPNSKKVVIDDMFRDGRWLDRTRIPILNVNRDHERISTAELSAYFFNFFHASLLNYSWRNSYVYVVGYGMTKSEFDDKFEDIDDYLKVWHNGYGWFLQSVEAKRDLVWHYKPREVPGLESLKSTTLSRGFNGADVINGSVNSFYESGYNFDGPPVVDHLVNAPWSEKRALSPGSTLGTFSLPICDLGKTKFVDGPWDLLDRLKENLEGKWPGGIVTDAGSQLMCYCRDQEDNGGQKFKDQFAHNDILDRPESCSSVVGPSRV